MLSLHLGCQPVRDGDTSCQKQYQHKHCKHHKSYLTHFAPPGFELLIGFSGGISSIPHLMPLCLLSILTGRDLYILTGMAPHISIPRSFAFTTASVRETAPNFWRILPT